MLNHPSPSGNRLLQLQQELRRRPTPPNPASAKTPSLKGATAMSDSAAHRSLLRQLEDELLHRQSNRASQKIATAQAYDFNEAIALDYSSSFYASAPNGSTAFALRRIQAPDSWIDTAAYQVESFDSDEPTIVPAPAPTPPQPTGVQFMPPQLEPPVIAIATPAPPPAPPPTLAPPPEPLPPPTPPVEPAREPAQPFSFDEFESASHSRAADADAFESDIRAILNGQKSPEPTPPPNPQSPTPNPPSPAPDSQENPHAIFDRLGRSVAYATTYNLGTVALEQRFDAFDQDFEAQMQPAAKAIDTQVVSAELSKSPRLRSMDYVEDLAMIGQAAPAQAQSNRSFDVRFDVPLIPQQTGMSCWAASAAMLVAWKHSMSVDPAEIANATGHWAQYRSGLAPEDTSIFPVWGMTHQHAQSYTVDGFRQLLETYGPLWVASAEPGPHVRVVTGLSGDGTPDGTTVYINDPWEPGMTSFRLPNAGGRYTETYAEFVRKQETLARSEMKVQGIYVAHLRDPR